MVEKILNNTTPYGKIRASHEGTLHSSTLSGRLPKEKNACSNLNVLYSAYLDVHK